MPSGCHRAGEFLAIVKREREIARRVALAAMRERFGEIGASVPLGALRRVGLEANIFIEVLHRALPDLQRMKLLLFCCRVVGTEVGILFGAIMPDL